MCRGITNYHNDYIEPILLILVELNRQDAHPSSQTNIATPTSLPGVPDHWNEIWLNILNDDF